MKTTIHVLVTYLLFLGVVLIINFIIVTETKCKKQCVDPVHVTAMFSEAPEGGITISWITKCNPLNQQVHYDTISGGSIAGNYSFRTRPVNTLYSGPAARKNMLIVRPLVNEYITPGVYQHYVEIEPLETSSYFFILENDCFVSDEYHLSFLP